MIFSHLFNQKQIVAVQIKMAPLAGIEPAHSAPEADALSTELQGYKSQKKLYYILILKSINIFFPLFI